MTVQNLYNLFNQFGSQSAYALTGYNGGPGLASYDQQNGLSPDAYTTANYASGVENLAASFAAIGYPNPAGSLGSALSASYASQSGSSNSSSNGAFSVPVAGGVLQFLSGTPGAINNAGNWLDQQGYTPLTINGVDVNKIGGIGTVLGSLIAALPKIGIVLFLAVAILLLLYIFVKRVADGGN